MAAASFPLPPDTNKPSVHHTLREINRLANSVGIVSFIRRLLIHFEDYLILPILYGKALRSTKVYLFKGDAFTIRGSSVSIDYQSNCKKMITHCLIGI